jgi:hypothetical protein
MSCEDDASFSGATDGWYATVRNGMNLLGRKIVQRNEINDVSRKGLSGVRDGNRSYPVVRVMPAHHRIRRRNANGISCDLGVVAQIHLSVILVYEFAGH